MIYLPGDMYIANLICFSSLSGTLLQYAPCVSTSSEGNSVNGRWSKQGCDISKEESNTTTTVCVCNHLTHFAILLSPRVEVCLRS